MEEDLLRPGPSQQIRQKVKKKFDEVADGVRRIKTNCGSKLNEFRSGYVDSKHTMHLIIPHSIEIFLPLV